MIIAIGETTNFCARKWWNKSEKMKNEEQLREKKACTPSFVQNEVLSEVKFNS